MPSCRRDHDVTLHVIFSDAITMVHEKKDMRRSER